jgi:hypothetical protein
MHLSWRNALRWLRELKTVWKIIQLYFWQFVIDETLLRVILIKYFRYKKQTSELTIQTVNRHGINTKLQLICLWKNYQILPVFAPTFYPCIFISLMIIFLQPINLSAWEKIIYTFSFICTPCGTNHVKFRYFIPDLSCAAECVLRACCSS